MTCASPLVGLVNGLLQAQWCTVGEGHRWHPNQLRHTAATKFRREFGIDVAQSILGHRLGSAITEVYAEADADRIVQIVSQVG